MKTKMTNLFQFPLVRIVVGTLALSIVYFGFSALLKPATNWLEPIDTFGRPVRAILTFAILLLSYLLLFKHYEKRRITELSIKGIAKEFTGGLFLGLGMIFLVMGILYLSGNYKVEQKSFDIVKLLAGFVVILSMAAAEEVIFRGVIFRICADWLGRNVALIISAVLFGLMHLANDSVDAISIVSAIAGGIMLCLAYSVTKRLWLPIALHTGWNFAQLIFGIKVSGITELSEYSPIKSRLNGNEWLVGNEFGIENSLLAIAFVVGVSILLYFLTVKNGKKAIS